jgi:hypothetical protein
VFFYSFRMFGGLWGQARAVSYPRSWAQAERMLQRDKGDWSAIYLPPFFYMRFDFTGSDYTITNPMPLYFTNRSVPQTSIEVGPVKLDRQPVDEYVQAALDSAGERGNLGAMLAPLGVRYVLMPLNDAARLFAYVERQEDLEVVKRWPDLLLLKNMVPTGRLTVASRTGSFRDWDEVGSVARGGVLTGSRLPRGETTRIPVASGQRIPSSSPRPGAIDGTVPGSSGGKERTLLVAEPYSPEWRASGTSSPEPAEQLGVVMSFSLGEDDDARPVTVRYNNRALNCGYVLSMTGLLLCLALIVRQSVGRRRRRKPPG